MNKTDLFEGLSDIYFGKSRLNKMMREFNDETNNQYDGIRAGVYYSQFSRLSIYVLNKYDITTLEVLKTSHLYEMLEYMRLQGFKESTLKSYITGVRCVYKEKSHLFSDKFILPTNMSTKNIDRKMGMCKVKAMICEK